MGRGKDMEQKDIKMYMKKAKMLFPTLGKKEKDYLRGMEQNLMDYVQDHPEVSLDQLYKEFGSPKDVVVEYLNCVDIDDLIKKIRRSIIIKRAVCSIVVVFFVVCIFTSAYIYKNYLKSINARIYTEETVIEYDK